MMLRMVALVLLLGCEVSKRKTEPEPTATAPAAEAPSAEVVALRDDVIAAVRIWGRSDYTPTDPAIIDPAIKWTLYKATKSTSRAQIVEDAAGSVASTLMHKPEGLAVLEKMLAERYAKPIITRDGNLVHIDVGVIAGKPGMFRGGLSVTSEYDYNGHGLITSEVVRLLKVGMAAHPDAKTYQVEVDIPGRWRTGWGGYTYVYSVDEDRIRMYTPDGKAYRTALLGKQLDTVPDLQWSSMEAIATSSPPVRAVDLLK